MTDQPDVKPVVKATKAEVKKRLAVVADLLVTGLSRANIIKYVAEKTDWHLRDRQVDTYIARATAGFKQAPGIDRQEQYKKAIRRMEMILSACLKVQDYARAIAAAKELHSLMALYEPPAKQTIAIEGLTEFSLLAEHAAAAGTDVKSIITMMLEMIGSQKP